MMLLYRFLLIRIESVVYKIYINIQYRNLTYLPYIVCTILLYAIFAEPFTSYGCNNRLVVMYFIIVHNNCIKNVYYNINAMSVASTNNNNM